MIALCIHCRMLSVQGVGGERRAKEMEESAGKIGCEWCGFRGCGVPRVEMPGLGGGVMS